MNARSPLALWFGFLGGMSAYFLHLIAAYWFVPFACRLGTRLPLSLGTVALAAVAAAATWTAWRVLRVQPPAEEPDHDPSPSPLTRAYGWAVLLGRVRIGAALLAAAVRGEGGLPSPERSSALDFDRIARDRVRFMAVAGLILSGVGLVIILYSGAAVAVLDPCR